MKSIKSMGKGLSNGLQNLGENFSEKNKSIKRTFNEKSKVYFPSLFYRNFRLFFFGQAVSLIGTWMQSVGQGWLVLTMTNSPLLLGVVTAAQFTPMLLFSLYAGVIIDRFPKRRILLITQSTLATAAMIFAILTWLKVINYWEIILLALVMGFANTFDMPTRQSFYIELVGKKSLMNAISLNSSIFNLARIIGPAIAGILIGSLGYALCFFLNSISYLPVIFGIYLIRLEEKPKTGRLTQNIGKDISEGLRYISKTAIIMIAVLLLAVVNVFGFNYNVIDPSFVKMILNLGATGYGLVMAFMGLGALCGSLFLAMMSHRGIKPWYIFVTATGVGIFSFIIHFQRSFLLFCVFLALEGFFMITYLNSTNTLIQINSPDHMRGRVMSIYSFVFGGLTPLGSLYAGAVSEGLGADYAFLISGIIVLLATALIYFQWYKRVPIRVAMEEKGGETMPPTLIRK
jgi:MFS family permease